MLLRIATTHRPATDLGYLLHKHPDRAQSFDLGFGVAHVFYPEANEERCELALLLDIDAVGLTRGQGKGGDRTLEQYVNDRPYAMSSFMSVAMSRVLGTALAGKSDARPDLVERPLPFEVRLAAVPSRGGARIIHSLFEPLGYEVEAARLSLDEAFPEWGESRFHDVTLRGTATLRDLLRHLYVLVPVLDDYKHYWVGEGEVEKLLSKGEGWLASHPERDMITRRYLRHRRSLAAQALARLVAEEEADVEESGPSAAAREESIEAPIRLHDRRLDAVVAALEAAGVSSILDLGCGEGKLLRKLLKQKWVTRLGGADVSSRVLDMAEERLKLDELPLPVRERIKLFQGSVLYRDERFSGYDAIAVVEVVEHLDEARLLAFEEVVFGQARPRVVVVTTPNAEYNVLFEGMGPGAMRHPDHRFEWTRAEFEGWCGSLERFGYSHTIETVGDVHPEVGAPSQMGVFVRGG